MKYIQRTSKNGYKYFDVDRDNWKEWFCVFIAEGEYKSFYYPVKRDVVRGGYECWVWYLAPFVLVIKLAYSMYIHLLNDTRQLLDDYLNKYKRE